MGYNVPNRRNRIAPAAGSSLKWRQLLAGRCGIASARSGVGQSRIDMGRLCEGELAIPDRSMQRRLLDGLDAAHRRVQALPRAVPGYLQALRRRSSRFPAIVMYHGLVDHPLEVYNWCQLPVSRFEEQICFLFKYYHVIPLMELVDRLQTRTAIADNAVALTFDDGFRSVYKMAHPILSRHNLPYTVFLVTGLVGTGQPAWPDQLYNVIANTPRDHLALAGREWVLSDSEHRAAAYREISSWLKTLRPDGRAAFLDEIRGQLGDIPVIASSALSTLSWHEVEELVGTGLVAFGSHSHSHPILSGCDARTQEEELRTSKELLQEHVGQVDAFAYPNGTRRDFTQITKTLLMRLGYECGLTTIPGLNRLGTDVYELRRVNVGADTTLAGFELRMLGL